MRAKTQEDRQILELVGKRQETSREIIRVKRETGHATRDYNREREVLVTAREVGQVALRFGANDFGSLMMEENVVSAAGTTYIRLISASPGRSSGSSPPSRARQPPHPTAAPST